MRDFSPTAASLSVMNRCIRAGLCPGLRAPRTFSTGHLLRNQKGAVSEYQADTAKASLVGILDQFKAPIPFAFGYGSGVFSQGAAQRSSSTQIDLILGVENAAEWHQINMEQNPSHYSSLRHLGPAALAWVQDNLGAGVYFNPFCTMNNLQVKYGVVSIKTLLDDLTNWRTLYLAGRLHKPVQLLNHNEQFDQAQKLNLLGAMSVALLMLPQEFSERDLYMKIAGVSYMGDVRMAVAENPRKIQNIVDNQFALFRKLYQPLMTQFDLEGDFDLAHGSVGPEAKGIHIYQPRNMENHETLLSQLPPKFSRKIPASPDAKNSKIRNRVSAAVYQTVKWPSFAQSAKGILTAGVGRSLTYSLQKLQKRWS